MRFGFDPNTLKEVSPLKNEQNCYGTRGIEFRPNKKATVGVFSANGEFEFFSLEKEKVQKRILSEATKTMYGESSFSFSPDGKLFLTSIYTNGTIAIFSSDRMRKLYQWKLKKHGEFIGRAKWVDRKRIIAGFTKPGILEVLELGKRLPIMKIRPKMTAPGEIYDMDIPKKRDSFVSVGYGLWTGPHFVFKMKLKNGETTPVWEHHEHSRITNTVKYSHCEKFVISGAYDEKIILASEKDGSIVFSVQPTFLTSWVFGISFSLTDDFLVLQSFNEVILFELERNSGGIKDMRQIDELKKDELDKSHGSISSFNVFWYSPEPEDNFLLIGLQNGKVFRVSFQSTQPIGNKKRGKASCLQLRKNPRVIC